MRRIASGAHAPAARRFILLREEGEALCSRGLRIRRYELTSLGYTVPGGHRRGAAGSPSPAAGVPIGRP